MRTHTVISRRTIPARLALALALALSMLGLPALIPDSAVAIDVAWARVETPGPAADVAIGPNGEPWIVLRDNRLFRWNVAAFEEITGQAAIRVAVGRNGVPWVLAPDGNGYRRVNDRWERLFLISRGADIAAAADGGFLYTDTRGVTSRVEADGNSGNRVGDALAARISVAPDGTPWIVQTDNKVVVPVNKAFRTLPGLAKDIGIGGNGAVWMTGTDDSIWIFTGLGWDRALGVAHTVAAGPDGSPWVINAGGELFRGVAPTAAAPAAPPAPAPFAPAAVTTRPLIAFLCKLADVAAEPRSREQVQAMLTGPGGFADYIREQSFGALSIEGTRVVGWLTLPQAAAAYSSNTGYSTLANDCAALAPDVQFPENAILAFFTNGSIDTGGVAYQPEIERGGVRRRYGATAYSEGGLTAPALVAHEVGHVLGMGHSLANWDPLGGAASGNPFLPDPVGPLGPGYNAPHRDMAGWIPAARKFRYTGTQQQITLTRLTLPTTNDLLMAQIPIGAGPNSYTVEFRTYTGSDAIGRLNGNIIPGEAVVIHRVEPRQIRDNEDPNAFDTRVVAADGGAPDSEGAMWRAGETFTDAANNVFVRIDELDVLRGTAKVTIGPVNAQAAPPPPTPQPTIAPPPPTPQPTTAPPPPPAPAGGPADNLANAGLITVPATVGPVSTAAATDEGGEPKPCGNIGKTLWLRFVAPATGQYTASTVGSSFDTALAAYRSAGPATGFGSLTPIDCNDDEPGGSRQSQLTFTANAGETIYLQAGGYNGETGDLTIRVVAGTP